jgi:hypothetical protein
MRTLAKETASGSARKDLVAHDDPTSGRGRAAREGSGGTPQDVARYIGQISVELSSMARKSDLNLLAYFLEMAHAEARAQLRKLEQDRPGPRS